MASLSDRAKHLRLMGDNTRNEFMVDLCRAIESSAELNHASATKIEALTLRVEELEAQLTALAKTVGPVVSATAAIGSLSIGTSGNKGHGDGH